MGDCITTWKRGATPSRVLSLILMAACFGYVAFAWQSALRLHSTYASRPFDACFAPGLVRAVETIRAQDAPEVFGPHPDASPYVYQRFSEMLYPVRYSVPILPEKLRPGSVYVLFPGDAVPVASVVIYKDTIFRVLEVRP